MIQFDLRIFFNHQPPTGIQHMTPEFFPMFFHVNLEVGDLHECFPLPQLEHILDMTTSTKKYT